MIKIDKFVVETLIGKESEKIKSVLVFDSCINLISFVLELGGSCWIILGVIRLAFSLSQKNGPYLQSSIWQIVGGLGVILGGFLFKAYNYDYNLVIKILDYGGKLVIIAGALWSLYGVIVLAEEIKNSHSPNFEASIWQIAGGIIICFVALFLKKIVVLN